jgi:hypothetical protein
MAMVFPFRANVVFQQREVQAWDLWHGLTGDGLKVSDHSNRGVDNRQYLRFPFGPLAPHEPAFLIEIVAHVVEFLDHGVHALLEFRSGQIMVNLLHLG